MTLMLELSVKDFKEVIIILNKVKEKTLEINAKIEVFSTEWETTKKNQMEILELKTTVCGRKRQYGSIYKSYKISPVTLHILRSKRP